MILHSSWDKELILYTNPESGFGELRALLDELELNYSTDPHCELYLPLSGGKISWHDTKWSGVPQHTALPAARLSADETAVFFTSIPSSTELAPSSQYLMALTRYLLDLLCHGKFIPSILRSENRFTSSWRILPDERLQSLSLSRPQSVTATRPGAQGVSESFLQTVGDALIRSFLSRSELGTTESEKPLDIWLESLRRPTGDIELTTLEGMKLDAKIRQWNGGLLLLSKKNPVKLALELLPPLERTGDWIIEISLVDSAGLLLNARRLFAGDLGSFKKSEYTAEDLEEKLLEALGSIVEIFPEAKRALAVATPSEIRLDVEEAYRFLKSTAAILKQSDIAVTLPAWWERRESQLGLRLGIQAEDRPVALSSGASNTLLHYSWQVALGDQALSDEEFQQLVKNSRSLVNLNGSWVELDPERLSQTAAFLKERQRHGEMSLIEALRLGYGADLPENLLPVIGVDASGWVGKLLTASPKSLRETPQPKAFLGELRHYQADGLSWLSFLSEAQVGGCLADDMGLGKTIQFLSLLLSERERAAAGNEAVRPTLLVVPMSILGNWERECRKFAPSLSIYIHHGNSRLAGELFLERVRNIDVVITTYSLAFRDETLFEQIDWGRIALDEAQNIKNLATKQTTAIRRLAFRQMQRNSPCQRLALTGTPLENRLEELWSIFDFLNPGYLGTLREFRGRFGSTGEKSPAERAVLARMIRPFVLRRLKSDPEVITDLPEKIEIEEFIPLTSEQAALYQSVLDDMLPQLQGASGIHRKGIVLTTITRLKQICDHPSLLLKDSGRSWSQSGKLLRLEEIVEEILAEGDKALIFSQFAQMGALLEQHLRERFEQEVLFLHGALTRATREKILDRFQRPDGPKLFVLSLKVGGYGLNLTEASHVIHFDQWWNPAVQEQATDRAYRIGQRKNVQVRKFISVGTLEEKINELLQVKRDLASDIVGSTKNMLTELSNEELKDLLSLSLSGGQ